MQRAYRPRSYRFKLLVEHIYKTSHIGHLILSYHLSINRNTGTGTNQIKVSPSLVDLVDLVSMLTGTH